MTVRQTVRGLFDLQPAACGVQRGHRSHLIQRLQSSRVQQTHAGVCRGSRCQTAAPELSSLSAARQGCSPVSCCFLTAGFPGIAHLGFCIIQFYFTTVKKIFQDSHCTNFLRQTDEIPCELHKSLCCAEVALRQDADFSGQRGGQLFGIGTPLPVAPCLARGIHAGGGGFLSQSAIGMIASAAVLASTPRSIPRTVPSCFVRAK